MSRPDEFALLAKDVRTLLADVSELRAERRRFATRVLQLKAALSAVRDIAEGVDTQGNNSDRLRQIRAICDEQASMSWADPDGEEAR